MARISKGNYPFVIPDPRERFTKIQALADLASENVLRAVDIVRYAHECVIDGVTYRSQWAEMLESVSLDPVDVALEDAEQADARIRLSLRALQERISDYNDRIWGSDVEQDEQTDDIPVEYRSKESKRSKLYDHPITSIIRWMGKEGWKFDEAKAAFTRLDISVADGTIRTQLRSGVRGDRGEPAPLTEDQADKLYDAAEEGLRS